MASPRSSAHCPCFIKLHFDGNVTTICINFSQASNSIRLQINLATKIALGRMAQTGKLFPRLGQTDAGQGAQHPDQLRPLGRGLRRFLGKQLAPGRGASSAPVEISQLLWYFCGQNCPPCFQVMAWGNLGARLVSMETVPEGVGGSLGGNAIGQFLQPLALGPGQAKENVAAFRHQQGHRQPHAQP
jgi:hypothetical protein